MNNNKNEYVDCKGWNENQREILDEGRKLSFLCFEH